MRTTRFIPLILAGLTLVSCEDEISRTRTYEANVPKYLPVEQFRQPIIIDEPHDITSVGGIYFKEGYIFITDGEEGIHVIDNADPASPQQLAFIPVPGAKDLVIKSTTMYVSSYTDLVILNVSDPSNAIELARIEDVLINNIPLADENLRTSVIDPEQGIVIGYELETVTEAYDEDDPWGNTIDPGWGWRNDVVFMEADVATVQTASAGSGNMTGRTQGVGGSMAGFNLNGSYLHVVDQWNMKTFDLSDKLSPELVDEQWLWREGETLFRVGDDLFIGTTSGMMIFDVSNAAQPSYRSEVTHFTGCDPVVVEEDKAYVTVRAGESCGWTPGWESQLMVIDVSNLDAPFTIATHILDDPYGLGVRDDVLFICDGDAGLKVFDAADPLTILDNQIGADQNIIARDVIPFDDHIMVIGEGGLNQYTYDGTTQFDLLSSISIAQ